MQALRDVLAEECGELGVFRDFVAPTCRALADAEVRQAMRSGRMGPSVWDAAFLLAYLHSVRIYIFFSMLRRRWRQADGREQKMREGSTTLA